MPIESDYEHDDRDIEAEISKILDEAQQIQEARSHRMPGKDTHTSPPLW
jgi:hypothetical protein